ncbi:MAG: F0F1 ATP synthase subunit gamma [Patescibacteria group bacterium]
MALEKEITEEINQLNALQSLVQAYEEIASLRMKKTRESVLKNRQFLAEINEIFERVRISFARQVKELAKKRGKHGRESVTFLAHNGKTVSVLLSANTGLYGQIVQATFQNFIEEARSATTELTIVGRYGLSLFLEEFPNRPYTYFDLPDYGITSRNLDQLIRHIVQYEEIHVYHGEFLNVIKQRPSKITISAEISLTEKKGKPLIAYIFEPTLEKILMFFETEIFASIFEQSVRESQLAKHASRVMAMDRADENIGESLKKLRFSKLRTKHSTVNRKQLNSLPSVLMR